MLVQFSVRNFKTFKEEAKLTLFASNYDKTTRENDNVFDVPKFGLRLLKSAVVYGANASGKTKLVEAAQFMREFIMNSSKESQQGESIDTESFRLSTATIDAPSIFEIVFIHQGDMFRYGFEVTTQAVVSEWLYHRPNTKEVEIFYREGQEFTVHPRLFRKGSFFVKEKMIRPNALMLSVAAQFNDELALRSFDWLMKIRFLGGLHREEYWPYIIAYPDIKHTKLLALLKNADIGIDDFSIDYATPIEEPDNYLFPEVHVLHHKYDENFQPIGFEEFQMSKHESSGTAKFFALTGPIIKSLEDGEILVVDEMDSKIHPNLVCKLAALFNSATTNPNKAQLIFNTHDTNLLGSGLFRRDQIWFVEKDRYGAASLYSLASFKTDEGGRKSDNYEENYISGRYGAIPILGDFDAMFHQETSNGK